MRKRNLALTVVMANHDSSDDIGGALESFLMHSVPSTQVVAIDDASTGHSIEFIETSLLHIRAPQLRRL